MCDNSWGVLYLKFYSSKESKSSFEYHYDMLIVSFSLVFESYFVHAHSDIDRSANQGFLSYAKEVTEPF